MEKGIKFIIPVLESIIYILITGLVKGKWYSALISAPAVLVTVGIMLFIRIKMELQPRGSIFNYYVISIFMAYMMCLLIL